MSILDYIMGYEQRASDINPRDPRDPVLVEWFGGNRGTLSRVNVTEETSLNFSAVFAAVRILAAVEAMLPLFAYRRQTNGDRDQLRAHPASWLLHHEPNPEQTPMMYRFTMKANALLWGNAYAEIVRDGGGRARRVWPLHPRRVRAARARDGSLHYEVSAASGDLRPGSQPSVPARDMIHIPNLMLIGEGITGKSVISCARESIGLGLAAEGAGASFMGKGMRPSGHIEAPSGFSAGAIERLRKFAEKFGGWSKTGSVPVLEEDAKWVQDSIPSKDAQYLETRQFQVNEIARWFGLPPHLIGDLVRSTFSNITEQSLEFVIYSLLPALAMGEQEYNRRLFTEAERVDHFVEHNVDGLLKGDPEKRGKFYATLRQWGITNVNELRRKENLNGIGKQGDVYLAPSNMVNAKQMVDPVKPDVALASTAKSSDSAAKDDDADADQRVALSKQEITQAVQAAASQAMQQHDAGVQRALGRQEQQFYTKLDTSARAVLLDVVRRMCNWEAGDLRKAAKRRGNFVEWVDRFAEAHEDRFRQAVAPCIPVCRLAGVKTSAESLAREAASLFRTRALAAADGDREGFVERVDALADDIAEHTAQTTVNVLFGDEP